MLLNLFTCAQSISKKIVARYLEQDPLYYKDLKSLSGKNITFFLTDVKLKIILSFTATQVNVIYQKDLQHVPLAEDTINLMLWGRSLDLSAFAFCRAQRSALLSAGKVQFQGDLFMLEALTKLFTHREFLENTSIPLPIKQLFLHHAPRFFKWPEHALAVVRDTAVDYLQEEIRLIPSYRYFELLQEEFLNLLTKLDRLEARLDAALT